MNFRDTLLKLARVSECENTDFLIRLADAVAEPDPDHSHALLIATAAQSQFIVDELSASRRISAIKELRRVTGCGMLAAKNATDAICLPTPPEPYLDPWSLDNEPPF